jgi:hypothetical protein
MGMEKRARLWPVAEVMDARRRVVRPMGMRRTAWIWAVGCVVWIFDGLVHVQLRQLPHAELAFVLAAMFFVAWMFFRQQPG